MPPSSRLIKSHPHYSHSSTTLNLIVKTGAADPWNILKPHVLKNQKVDCNPRLTVLNF